MTLDEAIAILSDMKIDIPVPKAAVTQIKRNLALDMAISALSCSEIPNSSDIIGRRAAIDAMCAICGNDCDESEFIYDAPQTEQVILCPEHYVLSALPSVQPERDIPIKPYEATDTAWGIPMKQAVCPKCDYYLGHVAFLGDYKGKKVTYCETCGQAIDWEGW